MLFTTGFIGRIMPFDDVHALTSGTCEYVILHGKMDFPDVVKVMDLEMGGLI